MAINWRKVTMETLYNRDDGICSICKDELKSTDLFEIDHIVEKSKGGSDDLNNLRLVHLTCHRKRHNPNRAQLPTKRKAYDFTDKNLMHNTINETERELLITTLRKVLWNQTNAAKVLGISERMVRYKMAKHNVKRLTANT